MWTTFAVFEPGGPMRKLSGLGVASEAQWSETRRAYLDVAVDEELFVDGLHPCELHDTDWRERSAATYVYVERVTICFASMHTVFSEYFRPQMSNRSSRLGPKRSCVAFRTRRQVTSRGRRAP